MYRDDFAPTELRVLHGVSHALAGGLPERFEVALAAATSRHPRAFVIAIAIHHPAEGAADSELSIHHELFAGRERAGLGASVLPP